MTTQSDKSRTILDWYSPSCTRSLSDAVVHVREVWVILSFRCAYCERRHLSATRHQGVNSFSIKPGQSELISRHFASERSWVSSDYSISNCASASFRAYTNLKIKTEKWLAKKQKLSKFPLSYRNSTADIWVIIYVFFSYVF